MPVEPLPIDPLLPEVLAALASAGTLVLRAPTGAGKTTRVPPALVDGSGRVLVLEPRRVAARAAARRMAAEHGTPLGEHVGYHVRFDRKAGPRTRVLVLTPGMLLRLLHEDPFLEGTSAIVFDEFHERGLEADLALGMVRLVRQTVRPDLRIVVMSATIDGGPVSEYLGNAPILTSEGRSFPVEIRYRPGRREMTLPELVTDAVEAVLKETPGDVLAFLPGLREIRQTAERLEHHRDLEVLPLHGDLPPEAQDRALRKLDRRKIVLATNVAETSVTVEGVTAVIDSGLARQMEFEASVGLDRLRLVPIAKASADQRAGRAGRTQPGLCVRLWDEPGHRGRPEQTEPEIRRVDLAGPVLQLLALGEGSVRSFPWLDAPRPEAIDQAFQLLERLGATSAEALTDLGRAMARLPVHPRLGRLLIEGQRLGHAERAALAAALLSERDPFTRDFDGPLRSPPPTSSDVLDRVEALEQFERNGRSDYPLGTLHRGGAKSVLEVRNQLLRGLEETPGEARRSPRIEAEEALLRAMLAAFPDRLARRRERHDRRAVLLGGRGVRLGPGSGVIEPELFVCVDVDAAGTDSLVRSASEVRREWLPAERIATRIEVLFDEPSERLIARKRTRYDDLILEEKDAHIADENEAARVLALAASTRLEKVLPPEDSEAGRFLLRLRCLKSWAPELALPCFDEAALVELLESLARSRRSLADLRHGPWLDHLQGRLTYPQLQMVEREAPDRVEVPSGSQIRLEYEPGKPPILAARIQELFGLTDTPRIAGGKVKVLLHLLAPNYRPQQVTDDLASFWKNTYPQVRKELRGRYPKHSWPDDPLTAEATRGVRRPR